MAIIRNLKSEDDGLFLNGSFDSVSLFQGEMTVSIFAEDGASEEDAVRCIEHYSTLTEKPEVLEQIQNGLEKYFLYMYRDWKAMGELSEDMEESLKPVLDGYHQGTALITYLYHPVLYVYPQQENEIGYGIECECPWDPEQQCCLLFRNDKVLYTGPSEGLDPWGNEDDYYCIWNN